MKPILLVLAAGMGSRYGGVKQIDSVGKNGECLLDFAAYDAMRSGFGKIVYIIRKDIEKDFREKLFDRVSRNIDADYVFQSHESLLMEEQIFQRNPLLNLYLRRKGKTVGNFARRPLCGKSD